MACWVIQLSCIQYITIPKSSLLFSSSLSPQRGFSAHQKTDEGCTMQKAEVGKLCETLLSSAQHKYFLLQKMAEQC